jgi:membrane protein DedA with SNARE-associated domain/rhodanese-related sulfurtransferase
MEASIQFLTQHGVAVLFIAVLAEQIGLPIPAVPFLIAAGALAGTGQMALGVVILTAVAAALIGDQIWFELGRRRGRPVLNWLCRISLEPTSCVRRTEDFFARHGMRALVVAKFIPGLSTIAPPLAGIVGIRTPQYLLYNGLGTVLWAGSGIGLGFVFSDQLGEAVSVISHLGPTIILILAGIVGTYLAYKVLHRYRGMRLVPRLTAQQLFDKIATGQEPVIIDLRGSDGLHEPPIPGSLSRSLEEVIARHHELPTDRDVILYCACPQDAASVHTAWKLREKGLVRVWALTGGIEAWQALNVHSGMMPSMFEQGATA